MTRFPYDTSYQPAMPVCQVSLSVATTGIAVGPLPAILDTGADGTLVPVRYLKRIGARRAAEVYLRSQWGARRPVFLYLVDIQIGTLTLPGSYVVGDEQGNEIVVGRNVLNRLRLSLDGPAQMTEIAE